MPSFHDLHKGLKRLLLHRTMKAALRETWRPFVGKTNGGADRDNGGKIVAMVPNKGFSCGTSARTGLKI